MSNVAGVFIEFTDAPGVRYQVTGELVVRLIDTPENRERASEDLRNRGCVGVKFGPSCHDLTSNSMIVQVMGYLIADKPEAA